MPATKTIQQGFTAETRHPNTDKRRRLKFATNAEASTRKATDKSMRDQLIEVVGDTTFKQAAADLLNELFAAEKTGVATDLRCHLGHMAQVLGNRKLRLQTPQSIGQIARDLRPYYAGHSEAYYKTGLDFLCRIIRFGFKHLQPPVSYKSEIPDLHLARATYASAGPQYNDRSIPKGDQVAQRLADATGGLRILLHLLILWHLLVLHFYIPPF